MNIPEWTFGDRVRKARKTAGLTQRQLAALIDKSGANIDSWETDRNNPRDIVATAERIGRACDVDPAPRSLTKP